MIIPRADPSYLAARRYYKATGFRGIVLSSAVGSFRGGSTDVDLLIRTGGEQRLSDFLLWECAFAELVFFFFCWPDFTVADLRAALVEFAKRERTRGALPQELAAENS